MTVWGMSLSCEMTAWWEEQTHKYDTNYDYEENCKLNVTLHLFRSKSLHLKMLDWAGGAFPFSLNGVPNPCFTTLQCMALRWRSSKLKICSISMRAYVQAFATTTTKHLKIGQRCSWLVLLNVGNPAAYKNMKEFLKYEILQWSIATAVTWASGLHWVPTNRCLI